MTWTYMSSDAFFFKTLQAALAHKTKLSGEIEQSILTILKWQGKS